MTKFAFAYVAAVLTLSTYACNDIETEYITGSDAEVQAPVPIITTYGDGLTKIEDVDAGVLCYRVYSAALSCVKK